MTPAQKKVVAVLKAGGALMDSEGFSRRCPFILESASKRKERGYFIRGVKYETVKELEHAGIIQRARTWGFWELRNQKGKAK